MKNRVISCLTAAILICLPFQPVPGLQKPAVAASSEAERTADIPEENKLSAAEAEEKPADLPEDLDVEKLSEDLAAFNEMISSEFFQSLLSYPQVQALAEQLIESGLDFASSEKELTKKILVTAGLDESTADTFMQVLEVLETYRDLIPAETWQEIEKDLTGLVVNVEPEQLNRLIQIILSGLAAQD